MATAMCTRCEARLYRQLCGCWIDLTRQARWCFGGHELHQPAGDAQPRTCCGNPAANDGCVEATP